MSLNIIKGYIQQKQYAQAQMLALDRANKEPSNTEIWECVIEASFYLHDALAMQRAAQALLQYNPNNAYAYYAQAISLDIQGHHADALPYFYQAYQIEPREAFLLGLLCVQAKLATLPEHLWGIMRSYDAFLLQKPHQSNAYFNRSVLAEDLGLYQLAIRDLEQTIALNENNHVPINARVHLGINKLRLGEYAEGWAYFEQRWHGRFSMSNIPNWSLPRWEGQEIGHAPLLVCCEQGFGDNIQFVRYAVAAKQCGYHVIVLNYLDLQDILTPWLAQYQIETYPSLPNMQVKGEGYYVSMMSLPHYLAKHIGSEPLPLPSAICVPKNLSEIWQNRLFKGQKKQVKIGLVWAGSAKHSRNRYRSISLNQLAPILTLNAEFHCLQKEVSMEDQAMARQYDNLFLWHEQIQTFSDTAALVEQMDLVISVDTSVAHLAGAMAKSVWTLLAFNPDFRWLLHRTDTPWYPNMRLFRQEPDFNWQHTIEQLQQALARYLMEHHT